VKDENVKARQQFSVGCPFLVITVSEDTPLSNLVKPDMGNCHWAACTYNPNESSSNLMFHTEGIFDKELGQYIT